MFLKNVKIFKKKNQIENDLVSSNSTIAGVAENLAEAKVIFGDTNYINQVMELDKQEEIYEYFMSADTDDIAEALDTCDIEDVTEEELRLMRIKFLSELAN